ncbi:MAG TPA: DUF559 domain-containing protein, partial [Microvirga sp.]|nr:DUF559 domain-containing protein [Microvirga sp.]
MTPSWRHDPGQTPTASRRRRARALRRALTEPEKRLWRHVRHRLPIVGTHFRTQVPIGPYVADFCCLIEVDGNQHGFEANQVRDGKR